MIYSEQVYARHIDFNESNDPKLMAYRPIFKTLYSHHKTTDVVIITLLLGAKEHYDQFQECAALLFLQSRTSNVHK